LGALDEATMTCGACLAKPNRSETAPHDDGYGSSTSQSVPSPVLFGGSAHVAAWPSLEAASIAAAIHSQGRNLR